MLKTFWLTRPGHWILQGKARFTAPDRLMVDGKRLEFAKAVLATGASPAVPNIPGLKVGMLTLSWLQKLCKGASSC